MTGWIEGIPSDMAISDMAVTPDNKKIILTGYRYVSDGRLSRYTCVPKPVLMVDVAQHKVIGGPDNESLCLASSVGISQDGTKAYIATGSNIEVLDIGSNPSHEEGEVKDLYWATNCAAWYTSISFSPDGSKAYAAQEPCSSGRFNIAVIDARKDTFIGWVQGLPPGKDMGHPHVKFDPDPARHIAYVTGGADGLGDIWVVNTQTDAWEKSITPGESNSYLDGFDFSPAGDKAFVSDIRHCGIFTIDVASAAQVGFTSLSPCRTKWPGAAVYGVAVSPDGSDVYAISTSDNEDQAKTKSRTVDAMDSEGKRLGSVVSFDGWNSAYNDVTSPIVFSTRNGGTAYVVKNFNVVGWFDVDWDPNGGDETKDWGNISNTRVAVVPIRDIPAQLQHAWPSTGVDSGGTRVLIKGSYLTGTTSVLFGGVAARDVAVVSDSEVTAIAPPHPVGTVDVTVVNPGGNATLENAFTYTTNRR